MSSSNPTFEVPSTPDQPFLMIPSPEERFQVAFTAAHVDAWWAEFRLKVINVAIAAGLTDSDIENLVGLAEHGAQSAPDTHRIFSVGDPEPIRTIAESKAAHPAGKGAPEFLRGIEDYNSAPVGTQVQRNPEVAPHEVLTKYANHWTHPSGERITGDLFAKRKVTRWGFGK